MTRLAAALIVSSMLAFFMSSAMAQGIPTICQPHNKIKEFLEKKNFEVLIAQGLAGNTTLFQLFANKKGQWTILILRQQMQGLACIQGAGSDFELTGNEYPEIPEKKKGDPA
jgi:hypothetical protein